MKALVTLTALLPTLLSQSAFADVYKCQLPDGTVKYQAEPCVSGKESLVRMPVSPMRQADPSSAVQSGQPTNPIPETQASLPKAGHSERPISRRPLQPSEKMVLRLPGVPLRAALESMALLSGNRLVIDPTISDVGDFQYEDTPWATILDDIARRYSLLVTVENGQMTVRRR